MYNGVRQTLFTQACYINSDFMSYDGDAKLRFLFNDDAIVSKCAQNLPWECMYLCMYVFKYVCKYAQHFTCIP